MPSAKNLNFGPPILSSRLSTNIPFCSKHTIHSSTSLSGIQPLPPTILGNLGIFQQNFNNEIIIVTYSFCFVNVHSIYYSHMYDNTNRKTNSFAPSRLLWKATVPLVFPLQNYKSSTKEVSGWKQCNIETGWYIIEKEIIKRS